MNYYLNAFKQYADFKGRTTRKDFWMFALINFIIGIIIGIIGNSLGLVDKDGRELLGYIYNLIVLLPSFAIGVRRLHDTNHSGWWGLFPIVNLFMFAQEGMTGPNKYGPPPVSAKSL